MNSTYLKKALTGIVYPPTQGRIIRISVTSPPPSDNRIRIRKILHFLLFSPLFYFLLCLSLSSFFFTFGKYRGEGKSRGGGGSFSHPPPPAYAHAPTFPFSLYIYNYGLGRCNCWKQTWTHDEWFSNPLYDYLTARGNWCLCGGGGGNMYSRGNIQMDKFKIRN